MHRLPNRKAVRDFSGEDFAFQSIPSTDFSHCNLEGSRFWGANINHCNFDNANVRFLNCAATLDDATSAVGSTFRNADLSGARLSGVYFKDANFTGACLEQTDLSSAFLEGVVSGGITGIPRELPQGWELDATGTLVMTGTPEEYKWVYPGI